MAAEQYNIDFHQGVSRNADEKTIHKAFKQQARKYNPDKVFGQEDKMKLLTMAKLTLLDPDKRAKYDANYEMNDDANLNPDLLKLNIGHRLSDNYQTKISNGKKPIKTYTLLPIWICSINSFKISSNLCLIKKQCSI